MVGERGSDGLCRHPSMPVPSCLLYHGALLMCTSAAFDSRFLILLIIAAVDGHICLIFESHSML